MKKSLILLLGGLALASGRFTVQTARATVALPFYEGYNFAEGNLNAVGGPNWVVGNGSSTFEIAVSNAATLTSPPNFPAASGKGVRRAPSGTARRSVLQFTSVPAADGNTVYVSFLLSVQAAPGSAQIMGFLDNNSSSQGSPQCGIFIDGSSRVGIGKKSSAPGFTMASSLSPGTHLVVACYTFQSGNDRVDLWVDPSSSDYGAVVAPASLGSATGGSDPPSLDFFQLVTSSGAGGSQYIDEFRVGTTWAHVVPGTVPPGIAAKLGLTTQPSTTQVNQIITPSVVVQIQDTNGIAVPSNNVPITLTLSSGTGTLYGTTTRNSDSSGKATFNDLYIDVSGTKQLTAIASGIGTGLSNGISSTFQISDTPVATGLIISQERMQSQGFVVDGHNDVPSIFCQILGALDAAAAPADWILVQYKNFNGSGDITFTNPISPAMPNAFYRLRTGDTATKTQPPSIGLQPQSLIVSPGATATFNVVAVGPLLQYLWYFNNQPISGATSSNLTIVNCQAGNVGNYYVVIANPAGNVTSATATLGVGNVAPTIVTQPQAEIVTVGGTAIFNVAAVGTAPLGYQWYHNTNVLLSGQTSSQLTLNNVSTNDAGTYSVIVSNAFGTAPSTNATLTVNEVPAGSPQTNLVGFAAGATGGAGGSEVTASDYTTFRNYCRQAGPLIIHVQGALVANENYTYVDQNDKTIVGDSTNAAFYGDLRIVATNIIVQNLYISATNHSSADGITIDDTTSSAHPNGPSKYVWVDHCTFYNCTDGSLDITDGADYVTVSWCKFTYAPVPPGVVNHEFVNLIASSDSDNGSQYHVTFHHNWYGDYCRERMPSVRFGRVHVFNNYYNCVGNNYCVRTRINAQVLVENNYYLGVQNPWERFVTSGSPGLLSQTGNITNNCTFVNNWTSGAVTIPGNDALTDPSLTSGLYPYTLDTTADIPYWVQTFAGSGKYPYVP